MSNTLKAPFIAALFLGTALFSPVQAQTAEELASRLNQMEEQMRLLVGQVEELTFAVKQVQGQLKNGVKTGAAEEPLKLKKAAQQPVVLEQPVVAEQGVERIGEAPVYDQQMTTTIIGADGVERQVAVLKAPGPKILGTIPGATAAIPDDGGFQGQVLVPPGGGEGQPVEQGSGSVDPDAIETVSLSPESPEALYERSNESLLRRQFGDAEAGFSSFVSKYPEHSLAGSAQYWLGETYYAQGDFRQAAQNFLQGYKGYPKSRRAPDSLLKLGISLNKLGQKQQACAAFGAIGGEFPNAVAAKKRAQAESKRASC
ncbi:MAG: tol-pal system protein YbgF [Aestuariivirga sp.]|nr:tol-pal system protein YbgF [Aestuariivirga sp.]